MHISAAYARSAAACARVLTGGHSCRVPPLAPPPVAPSSPRLLHRCHLLPPKLRPALRPELPLPKPVAAAVGTMDSVDMEDAGAAVTWIGGMQMTLCKEGELGIYAEMQILGEKTMGCLESLDKSADCYMFGGTECFGGEEPTPSEADDCLFRGKAVYKYGDLLALYGNNDYVDATNWGMENGNPDGWRTWQTKTVRWARVNRGTRLAA